MTFEDLAHAIELFIDARHLFLQSREWLWCANAGHHIFALCVDEVLAIENVFACRGVAGKANSRRAGLAHVAEHHGAHIYRGAPIVRNIMNLSVLLCSVAIPAAEHSSNRRPQLFFRILRKSLTKLAEGNLFKVFNEVSKILSIELGVIDDPTVLFQIFECVLENV